MLLKKEKLRNRIICMYICIMKCITCEKDLSGKSKKFCSNKCKQKFDRDAKIEKLKNVSTSVNINDALSKQIEYLLSENKRLQDELNELKKQPIVNYKPTSVFTSPPIQRTKIKTVEMYVMEKRELMCDEDYIDFKERLWADTNLTDRQKKLVEVS